MASPLALQRFENSLDHLVRKVSDETPHVHFARFSAVMVMDNDLHAACTVCGGREKYDLQYMTREFGRDALDRVINFVLDFQKNHRHLPAAESPKVPTEQPRIVAEGRKFRV